MDQRPGRYRPGLERLEARDLPSAAHAAAAASTASGRGTSSTISQLAASLYAPVTTTAPTQVGSQVFPAGMYAVPQPTAAEVRSQTISAKFVGTYYVGAPRFSNQSETIHIYSNGKDVSSNSFLHGRAQIILFPPADPAAQPTTDDPVAGQVTGLAALYAANVLQSGSLFFADLTNVPGVSSNDPAALDRGLPSHLQFLVDPAGVSGGVFATPAYSTTPATTVPLTGGSGGAVAFTQGAGYIDLKYFPASHPGGARRSGKVVVTLYGLANLTGVTNPLYKGIN
jgi:hypothetical protein